MTPPRETVHAVIAAFNAHDLSTLARFFTPDVVIVSPDAGEVKGREQATEWERSLMETFPDGMMEIAASYDSGDTVVVEWVFRGTNTGPLQLPGGETLPATGKQVSVRGVDISKIENGAVASLRAYWDQLELMTQLGLMPEA